MCSANDAAADHDDLHGAIISTNIERKEKGRRSQGKT